MKSFFIFLAVVIGLAILAYYIWVVPSNKPKDNIAPPRPSGDGTNATGGTASVPLTDEELNPANAGRLAYAKVDHVYIILPNGQHDTTKKLGDFLGVITNNNMTDSSTTWDLNNGNKAYKSQVATDLQIITGGRG